MKWGAEILLKSLWELRVDPHSTPSFAVLAVVDGCMIPLSGICEGFFCRWCSMLILYCYGSDHQIRTTYMRSFQSTTATSTRPTLGDHLAGTIRFITASSNLSDNDRDDSETGVCSEPPVAEKNNRIAPFQCFAIATDSARKCRRMSLAPGWRRAPRRIPDNGCGCSRFVPHPICLKHRQVVFDFWKTLEHL